MRISEVQKFIRDRLENDPFVSASRATVICADDGDSVAAVEKAMAEVGLAVIVAAPKWKPTTSSAKNAVGDLFLTVNVSECPELNRAGDYTVGLDLAEHVAVLLNLEKPFPNADILALSKEGITSAASQDGSIVVWSVPFTTVHQISDLNKKG